MSRYLFGSLKLLLKVARNLLLKQGQAEAGAEASNNWNLVNGLEEEIC